MARRELYLGLMSGTSMDGLDMVLVEFEQGRPDLLRHQHYPLEKSLRQGLQNLCTVANNELDQWGKLDRLFARFSAHCILNFLEQFNLSATAITAIGSHGQTVRHQPDASPSYTLQLGDPNTIAALTGIPVIADFRRKDV